MNEPCHLALTQSNGIDVASALEHKARDGAFQSLSRSDLSLQLIQSMAYVRESRCGLMQQFAINAFGHSYDLMILGCCGKAR